MKTVRNALQKLIYDEHEKSWQLALSYYARYEKYKARAQRKIPIMGLESKGWL